MKFAGSIPRIHKVMKVSLFTEIQCPYGASPQARLEEFLEQAVLADRLGYRGDYYWFTP